MRFIESVFEKLKRHPKRIVFPEGAEPRVLEAASRFNREQLGAPILLGDVEVIERRAEEHRIDLTRIGIIDPTKADDLPMQVVVPAYILSELKAGFAIGAVLYLPFLLIDIVTASITTSIGMFQLPPVVISTPLKILLFVMVDGWNLLAGSLLKSF